VRLPYPHPGQQAVLSNLKRFTWLCAGRRWRKTTLAMSVCVERALQGQRIIWGAPTHDQNMVCIGEVSEAIGELVGAGIMSSPNLSRKEVVFPSGGRIIFRSLDNPDNARGHTADGVVIDEGQDVTQPEAWHQVLRPMLIDTDGWALNIFTPKPGVWCVNEWGYANEREDSIAFQAPTLGVTITPDGLVRTPHPLENPNIPFSEIELVYRTTPERSFRQEYMGEMLEFEGAIFRNLGECTVPTSAGYNPDHRYVIGVDWGRTNDFSVFTVLDTVTKRVVQIDRSTGVEYAIQRGRLQVLNQRYLPVSILAESNAMGLPIIEQLQRDGLPVQAFETTAKSKGELIDKLALAFEQKVIGIPDDKILLAELSAFQAERTPAGNVKYGAPSGMHDDTVMSLALAWWAGQLIPVTSDIWNVDYGEKAGFWR
jgi:hypothetical protein